MCLQRDPRDVISALCACDLWLTRVYVASVSPRAAETQVRTIGKEDQLSRGAN